MEKTQVEKTQENVGGNSRARFLQQEPEVSAPKTFKENPMSDVKSALEQQKQVIGAQYAEVSLSLRQLEAREKELGAALRLIYDQIRAANEQSGNSAPQSPETKAA